MEEGRRFDRGLLSPNTRLERSDMLEEEPFDYVLEVVDETAHHVLRKADQMDELLGQEFDKEDENVLLHFVSFLNVL